MVTIMIPTFAQADVLAMAIDSALAQDYPALEVVVADDASPDGTAELMTRYANEPRLRYIRSSVNNGRVGNYRRTLAQQARGDLVLNLDGDDWLSDPHYISDAIALMQLHPELVMVFARSRVYDQASATYLDVPLGAKLPMLNAGTDLFLRYADGTVSIPHLTALYRRDVALELGFYSVDVLGADSVALLSMLPGRAVGFIDRPVAVWRKHAQNATWTPDVASRIRNFAVADLPAKVALQGNALPHSVTQRWRRGMATVLAQSFMEDCIAGGKWGTAARFVLATSMNRPAVSMLASKRVMLKGIRRIFGRHT